jgi:hypothetical protein
MAKDGDALYLPLKRGRNQLVFAVIQCTGGWAYSARLDPTVIARGAAALVSCVALALPADNQADLPAIAEVVNARVETVTYRGVRAIHLVPAPEAAGKDEDMLALLDGPTFTDGTIEVDLAGAPRPTRHLTPRLHRHQLPDRGARGLDRGLLPAPHQRPVG